MTNIPDRSEVFAKLRKRKPPRSKHELSLRFGRMAAEARKREEALLQERGAEDPERVYWLARRWALEEAEAIVDRMEPWP